MWHCVQVRWKRAFPSGGASGAWAKAGETKTSSNRKLSTAEEDEEMRALRRFMRGE
jgi:hypothetical protein